MALLIKNLTIKNFMSVGNVSQAVKFDQHGLTLVLGNNLDQGGDGSRNGTGKTTLLNALCYGLYGTAVTDIRKDNLVNKTNAKNMLVTVEFEKNGHSYKIERGRKPNIFRFLVNDSEVNNGGTDEGQGESKLTQEHIERVLGLSADMFRHIVALNTYTPPFLSLKANDQREIIEQLLGITQLSEKATVLKESIKLIKDSVKEEEFKIKAQQESNLKIEKSIADLERRSSLWLKTRETDIEKLHAAIKELENINIDQELAAHKELTKWREQESQLRRLNKDLATHSSAKKKLENQVNELNLALSKTQEHTCHACGQDLHDAKQESMLADIVNAISVLQQDLDKEVEEIISIEAKILELGSIGTAPSVRYQNLDDAINHKTTIENFYRQLEDKLLEADPYSDQISHLKATALTEISWDKINELSKYNDHQEFLLKLLTNKDSFIRKKIIEQNLSYLNHRLEHYLEKLGLPHIVKFQSDLTVEITQLGQEFDFDNLSRGERNRLILGLSWSFRDVFESLNHPINLTVLDEVVDSGMDPNGVDSALGILKTMGREQNKNIFLISHRDELVGRVNTILKVTKENGFTTFDIDVDMIET
jgi:DNA repair exonuclease SbcCD ATPase subunit